MKNLPNWLLTNRQPATYDRESATAIEMVAKLYGAMQELITECNDFENRFENAYNSFINTVDANFEDFKTALRQEFQDFIDVVNLALMNYESEFNDVKNLAGVASQKADNALNVANEANGKYTDVNATATHALAVANEAMDGLAEVSTESYTAKNLANNALTASDEALNKAIALEGSMQWKKQVFDLTEPRDFVEVEIPKGVEEIVVEIASLRDETYDNIFGFSIYIYSNPSIMGVTEQIRECHYSFPLANTCSIKQLLYKTDCIGLLPLEENEPPLRVTGYLCEKPLVFIDEEAGSDISAVESNQIFGEVYKIKIEFYYREINGYDISAPTSIIVKYR